MKWYIIIILMVALLGGCASMQNPYEPGTVQYEQWETRRQLQVMQYQQQMQHTQTQNTLQQMQYNQHLYNLYGF